MIDIKGYEELYSITENGDVWSKRSNKFLKKNTPNGYFQVSLCNSSGRRNFLVHRLVLENFGSVTPNRNLCVNHKNGLKLDNRVDNLEWVTHQENMNHAKKYGLTACGSKNGNSKITSAIVKKIRNQTGRTYTDISNSFGISRVQVSNIINKRQWQK